MKKILMSLVLVAGLYTAAWAQPTFTIADATVNTGGSICLPVTVKDFTTILSTEMTFEWDPTELAIAPPTAQNFNVGLPGLGIGNFTATSDSTLALNWEFVNCFDDPTNIGITLPDDEVVFEICFTSLAGYGTASQVCIADNPAPVVYRNNSNCLNIGLINECGTIYTGVEPFILSASDEYGNMGDLVCVDFTVEGFNDLQSTQFDIVWDESVLECVNQIPGNVPNLSVSNFNCLPGGSMRVSWASLPDQGANVDDGTVFFTACFNLLAPCESFTSIDLDLSQLIEITNTTSPDEGFSIPYEYNAGSVTTGDCDPIGLQLFADCGAPVNINDQFCVEVTVGDNFNSITDMNFLMEWNEQILTFDQIQNFHPNVANLENEIDYTGTSNGFINVAWDAPPPASIPNGDVLFDVCFTVTGLGGNSPFTFAQFPANVQVTNGPNIGINPSNCQVEVIQPDGVAMTIGSGSAATGDEFCIDIDVANFDSITSYQYSLSWDPALFQLNSSTVMNYPGASNANVTESGPGGLIFFDFNGTDPITLDDGTTIMQICFEPLSTPGTCNPLEMITVPLAPEAISAASNGQDIGIIDVPGELCTLFPEGFGIYVQPTNGLWLESICVPITVESFDNITDAVLSLNWDPTLLSLTGINNPNTWPGLMEGVNLTANFSSVDIDWHEVAGTVIPDGTVVFELCFDLIGDAPTCTPISVSQSPEPQISTSNGQGSLTYEDGEVCIEDQYIITDLVILPTTCPDACDGEITFSVIGGTEPLGTSWMQNGQPQFQPFHATNLCAGDTVYVTVFDNSNPTLLQDFTFVVPLDTLNVPTADGGPDVTINCNTMLAQLEGEGTPADADMYWTGPDGLVTGGGSTIFASDAGQYIFHVENINTGCAATDTVIVFPKTAPIVEAGDDLSYTCLSDTLMLDGTGSAVGDTIDYTWIVLEGGNIVVGDENLLMPNVTGPGLYQLSVRNNLTVCTSTDTVRVVDDQILPEAIINNGAETATLACDTDIVLSASTQNNPPLIVEYEWFDLAGNSLSQNPSIGVSDLGTYILVPTNTLTGCMASDTIEVIPNEDFPIITMIPAGDTSLTCIVDTIQFNASVDGIQENLIYNWATSNGEFVPGTDTTLTPTIVSEGLYTFEVTDTTTNCTAIAEVLVTLDTIAPIADAGPDLALTCTVATDTLIGTTTSTGDNIAYIWTNSAGDTLSTEIFLIVSDAGTYCLEVLNTDSGCSSTDCAEVTLNAELPVITSDNFIQSLTCENDTLTLIPDMITSPNNPYIVAWIGDNIIGPTDTDSILVDQPGIYQIRVIDPVTGCVGVGDFVIDENITPPTADAGMDAIIDCNNDVVTIGSLNSSTGDDFTYLWINTVDGEVPTPGNTITIDVMTPGTYQLTVTNIVNGCTATDDVVVTEDLAAPEVFILDPEMITCANPCVELTANAGALTDITVAWTGLDGGSADPVDALVTSVCVAGNYEISVTNNINGCVSLDTVLVEEDIVAPEISFETPADFTCAVDFIEIDASATGAESDFSTIEWTGPGNITPATGSLIVSVDAPGDYELHVVFASNGCEATQMVTVVSDMEDPVADAGPDATLFCGDIGVLDGTGSSQGADFEYLWTAIEGTIVDDVTVLDPMIEGAGIYEILVTNTSNGCTSSDIVEITFEFPADAMTMPDSTHCGDSIIINANLPANTTGVWTTTSGAVVADPTSNTSLASPLQSGDNMFIWTLSADACPNYDADTLIISSEANPIANNDLIELTEEIRFGSANLAANDILSGGDYEITILSEPAFGQMDSLVNGVYHYSVGPGAGGEVEVTYQICSTVCPDKCDEGTIIIIIPDDPNEPEIANTITPNDDGLNDVLIFDIIANNSPDEFPDNEIIVFNRWGDIVYQAAPYNNDWGGLNDEGNELPHGTYYYILRLNISKGEIIRGDITIIK